MASEYLFVRSVTGRVVRDPADKRKRPLPAAGKRVPKNAFWLRRIKDGDVVRGDDTATAASEE